MDANKLITLVTWWATQLQTKTSQYIEGVYAAMLMALSDRIAQEEAMLEQGRDAVLCSENEDEDDDARAAFMARTDEEIRESIRVAKALVATLQDEVIAGRTKNVVGQLVNDVACHGGQLAGIFRRFDPQLIEDVIALAMKNSKGAQVLEFVGVGPDFFDNDDDDAPTTIREVWENAFSEGSHELPKGARVTTSGVKGVDPEQMEAPVLSGQTEEGQPWFVVRVKYLPLVGVPYTAVESVVLSSATDNGKELWMARGKASLIPQGIVGEEAVKILGELLSTGQVLTPQGGRFVLI